jgi:hypothetical protein
MSASGQKQTHSLQQKIVLFDHLIRIALTASAAPIKPANDFDQEWTPSEALQRFLKRTESG